MEVLGLVFDCSVLPLPIAGLSSIRLCVSRDLVAFLIPELSKLEEAMKLRLEVSPLLSIVSLRLLDVWNLFLLLASFFV